MIRISPSANVMLPHQFHRRAFGACCAPRASGTPTPGAETAPPATEIRNTSRQSIGAAALPSTRPTNMPAERRRCCSMPQRHPPLVGGEGVGVDDRGRVWPARKAAPIPCTTRKNDQVRGPGSPGHPVHGQHQRSECVDDEAEVVHLHSPVHVPQPDRGSRSDARHDQEAEDHPQQIEAVGRNQPDRRWMPRKMSGIAISVNRAVQRGQQHPERDVRQRHPLVGVARIRGGARGGGGGGPCPTLSNLTIT